MGDTDRHILHVDMDAFHAAVEQHDNPARRPAAAEFTPYITCLFA